MTVYAPDPDHDFNREITCTYKDEKYSVRDNGAVLRHPRKKGKIRPTDNQWTFGKPNKKTGYREIASKRVHRIVAYAFHGEPPTKEHVVDHIDTNKQNNRPENLRWVTRLENILLNPITAKRIAIVCGSVEAFLADPSKYRDKFPEPNYKWMCTVSKEEAQTSLERLTAWAKIDMQSKKIGALDEWIFNRDRVEKEQRIEEIFKEVKRKTRISREALCYNKAKRNNYYDARKYAAKLLHFELNLSYYEIGNLLGISSSTVKLYIEVSADSYSGDYAEVNERYHKRVSEQSDIIPNNVIQKNWDAESAFPCCPQEVNNNPIEQYSARLKKNSVFFYTSYYSTTMLESAIIDKAESLLVMYEIEKQQGSDKRWGLMKIIFENQKYVHEIILNYNGTQQHYSLIEVENHFKCIVKGDEWAPLKDSQGRGFKDGYRPL